MKNEKYGAPLERGVIEQIKDQKYTVASISRKGITSPPIPSAAKDTLSIGDLVFFFLFDDGDGLILAKTDS